MTTLYFICSDARQHRVSVAVVNNGQPLTYGQGYEVSDELAAQLLENAGDWSKTKPGAKAALAEVPPQVAGAAKESD